MTRARSLQAFSEENNLSFQFWDRLIALVKEMYKCSFARIKAATQIHGSFQFQEANELQRMIRLINDDDAEDDHDDDGFDDGGDEG